MELNQNQAPVQTSAPVPPAAPPPQSQSMSQPPVQKKSNMLALILVALFLLVVTGIVYYLVLQQSKEATPPIEQTDQILPTPFMIEEEKMLNNLDTNGPDADIQQLQQSVDQL